MSLDRFDLRMALCTLRYYERGLFLSKVPLPSAANRLKAHIEEALSVDGQKSIVPQEKWLTTAEFARRMGCSQKTACRRAAEIGHRFGRVWAIPESALPQEEYEDGAD